MSEALQNQLLEKLQVLKVVSYFDVAAATMFVYDYFLTLGMEVDFVWKSKWNLMKFLYLGQRYMPFVDSVFIVLYHEHVNEPQSARCKQLFASSDFLTTIGMGLSELILTTRVWAVWQKNTKIAIFLAFVYLAAWLPQFYFFEVFLKSLQFTDSPLPGCVVLSANQHLIVSWSLLMVFHVVVLALMIIAGLTTYSRYGSNALYATVFGEGLTYYFYLCVLSVANVVIIKALPPYEALLLLTERCLHSMLTSRVLLHIRRQARLGSDGQPSACRPDVYLDPIELHSGIRFGNNNLISKQLQATSDHRFGSQNPAP